MGEKGVGKSTLMTVIAGVCAPDCGEVRIAGKPLVIDSPPDALQSGGAKIHLEPNLMNTLTSIENTWIHRAPKNRFGLTDHGMMNRMAQDLFDRLKIQLTPFSLVVALTVAEKRMVETSTPVSRESDVLILDQPTLAFAGTAVEHLFTIIRDPRARGIGIGQITFKMNKPFEIADDLTVFRDGQQIGICPAAEVTRDDVIQRVVGREITNMFPRSIARSAKSRGRQS